MSPWNSRNIEITQYLQGEALHQMLSKLHRLSPQSVVAGRNVIAGYTRGWGLQFGSLSSAIENDFIYQESLRLTCGRSLVKKSYLKNIFLIMKYGMKDITGDIIEFGSYCCGSAIFIANVARRLGFTGTVYALDTFAGMPVTEPSLDLYVEGDFGKIALDNIYAYIKDIDLRNLVLVKGPFEKTVPELLEKTQKIILAHIDCDIYSAVKYAIASLQPHMHPSGGYLVFDDPLNSACIGALQAVEEVLQKQNFRAEQAYPHLVYRMPPLTSCEAC